MSRALPFVLLSFVGTALLLAGCDALGGNDDGDDEPDGSSPLAMAWTGTYEGTGSETDYFGGFSRADSIEPTLTVALQDSTLIQLRLAWQDRTGDVFAETTGEPTRVTPDTLVTPFETVDADSFRTEFQFRLGRDTVAGGTSIQVQGTLEQQYEGVADENADSTLVQFRVSRPAEQGNSSSTEE